MIMTFERFSAIFNEIIFEKSKADLVEKIALNPSRYIGLFRPTKPKAKILQNLLQSHEIRFGDAFEAVIQEYLQIKGCELLPKRLFPANGDVLNLDQCFKFNDQVYFIEQKVRDDHDSTKKRGQIQNFEKKLGVMRANYPLDKIVGVFYFIDSELIKNKKFYVEELQKMSVNYDVETQIFYGKPLFDYLGFEDVWLEIVSYLKDWKMEVPDVPEINFDADYQHTFEEIKDLEPKIFRKLFSSDQIFNEIVLTLFPEKRTLFLLRDYFLAKSTPIYSALADRLSEKLA